MARTTTYDSDGWKIWTYNPVSGYFILDFTKLDDATAPLSATEGTITQLSAEIASIVINEGTTTNGSIFSAPTPSTADVELELLDFVKTDANKFLAGTEIWITYTNGELYDNNYANLGRNTPIFMGKITSFAVNVEPGTNIAIVSISADSNTAEDFNTLIPINTSSGTDKNVAIQEAAATYGIYSNLVLYATTFYPRGNVVKSYGEWIAEMCATELLVPTDNTDVYSITGAIGSRSIVYKPGVRTFSRTSTSVTFDETQIIGATVDWSNGVAPTTVTLTNEGDSSIVYQKGSSTAGGYTYSADVDLVDISWMTQKGDSMVNYKKNFVPTQIRTITARTNQSIEWADSGLTYAVYVKPKYLAKVGQRIAVTLTDQGFTAETMAVTGRRIEITPDTWITTYDLWKGFTF